MHFATTHSGNEPHGLADYIIRGPAEWPPRTKRIIAAGIALLVHTALMWLFLLPRLMPADAERTIEPVIATLIDQPLPRNLSLAPTPIQVNMEGVVHLQRLAPKIQDIPVEKPEPPTAATVPLPASAPLPQHADSGLDGASRDSSGHSGGGYGLTLLERVIPRYPVASARRREEGATQVLLHVDKSGHVSDVKITRSSGFRRLDEAAVDAFRKWRFAALSAGSADGEVVQTEQRFILYRLRYSRLGDKAADKVDVEEVHPATDQAAPGSEQALRRFIEQVRAGTYGGDADFVGRIELTRMRAALEEWGAVKSMEFAGSAGPPRWTAYDIRAGSSPGFASPMVEVRWNVFEVRHEHATTEWLVAVDRNGTLWTARVSRAPWT